MRREFRAQETDKNLLQEECSRLKALVFEVENTIKEILESVDKLQADLDESNNSKFTFENWAKSVEDQMAILH